MKVAITGAAGIVGTALASRLGDHDLILLDRRRTRGCTLADSRRIDELIKHFDGADAVIDLASEASPDTPWETAHGNNLPATINALEAARRTGVPRVIFASSNHVTGRYESESPYRDIGLGRLDGLTPDSINRITPEMPIRPDGPYAIGKAMGEAAARYCSEQHGLSVLCLRIGTVNAEDRPLQPRHLATLLSHADLERLVRCCLDASEALRFGVHYGVSNNLWRFWSIAEAKRAIGFIPDDDAERYRQEVPWSS